MSGVELRRANESDLEGIARAHIECFPGYFLTSLGRDLLSKYYREYLREGAPFFVAQDRSRIIGFAMGYVQGSSARHRFERSYCLPLAGKLLHRCLCGDRRALGRIWGAMKSIMGRNRLPVGQIDIHVGNLLSVCVLEEYRGAGTAVSLLLAFETALRERKVSRYSLSVNKNNPRARAFYEKMGFVVIREGDEEAVYGKNV